MGISSMPEPRDSLLGYLVYNTVISIAALAGLVRAVPQGLPAGAVRGAGVDGHLFHRACLETWLRYERATCPLCRAHVPLPADETPLLRYPEFE
uniref:Zinc finger RING-H2-type domain-containing protein n=1 Tax=Zea mays TaxID=4577 RepID=B6SY35_MAIZE|nr:hypothetical protein [Zea mays]